VADKMSEVRLDRIEAQISELREFMQQGMMVMQQDITVVKQDVSCLKEDVSVLKQDVSGLKEDVSGLKQYMTAMKQNVNALREDIGSLRQRVDSLERTMLVAMRDGFDAFRMYMDDLNFDLASNEQMTRRLSRRVSRLERWYE
jgi:polyhydroxyalkanoate synthesis regulator phasin